MLAPDGPGSVHGSAQPPVGHRASLQGPRYLWVPKTFFWSQYRAGSIPYVYGNEVSESTKTLPAAAVGSSPKRSCRLRYIPRSLHGCHRPSSLRHPLTVDAAFIVTSPHFTSSILFPLNKSFWPLGNLPSALPETSYQKGDLITDF